MNHRSIFLIKSLLILLYTSQAIPMEVPSLENQCIKEILRNPGYNLEKNVHLLPYPVQDNIRDAFVKRSVLLKQIQQKNIKKVKF